MVMASFRVLFVDDEEELVSAVVERLGLRGVDARGATSGAEALKLIEEEEFQAVVLDVKMPGLGGLQVIRQAKERHPNLAVVLLSGHGSVEDVAEGLRLGASDYLQKPIDIDDLLAILHQAAERTREGPRV
jgi:DNA-binding NtrC family response regulator